MTYFNETEKHYEDIHILRKVVSIKKSFFETEGGWRFYRLGGKKKRMMSPQPEEYKSLVEQYGKPESVGMEIYKKKLHGEIEFL